MIGTARLCRQQGIKAKFACTKETDDELAELNIEILKNNQISGHITKSCVIGTTAWGFSRDDMVDKFDYLFIDEAGQVSVANLIAISRATNNLVLMGDQMQFGLPTQGTHPTESGLSILDYLLHDKPTIPDDMGVFLATTYRMHSAVNEFISHAIYEGKLESDLKNNKQIISVPEGYNGDVTKTSGITFMPIEHDGNTQASDEEVQVIVDYARELLGRNFTDKNGSQRPISCDDILFVAPYNHQVNKLQEALGPQAKVGSVDKFQGQEAPIVFLSMCASEGDSSPRGMDFLFSKNRLNVAISRAQSMGIVVASDKLSYTRTNNIGNMELINSYCQLVRYRTKG